MEGKIVYAYVVADILHTGHILALENAKSFGKLIVGVLTDEAVQEKKPKPTLSFQERLRVVKALRCVDAVVAQETYSPIGNINVIQPDILMESTSHNKEELEKIYEVTKELNIRVLQLPYYPEQSSTNIKECIKQL